MKPRVLINALGLADITEGKLGGNFYHVYRLVSEIAKLPEVDLFLLVDACTIEKFKAIISTSRLIEKGECYGPGVIGNEFFSLVASHAGAFDLYYRPIGQLTFLPFYGVGISGVADINFHDLKWRGLKRWYKEVSYRYSFIRGEAVIAISDFTRGRISCVFDVPLTRSVTVHHGAESCYSGNAETPLPHVASGEYWLCFGHRSNKNLELTVAAFALYREAGGLGRLVVLGENKYSRSVLSDLFTCESIDVIAYVSDAELAWLYTHARGLLFPSIYEGFGLPLLEAMRCGCPVLASDIEVHREVAGSHAACLLPIDNPFEWSVCMLNLEQLALFRATKVRAGFGHIANFTWKIAARKTVGHLLSLFKNQKGVVV